MIRARVVAFFAAGLCACTLTHPLDRYSSDYGDATDGGGGGGGGGPDASAVDADALDGSSIDATVDGAPHDGCVGVPMIVAPLSKATVGDTVTVTVAAPSCISTMIVYIDSKDVLHVSSNSVTNSFAIDVGTHTVNVNGWAHTDYAHSSDHITFTRAK
jgi:hypothetical protein